MLLDKVAVLSMSRLENPLLNKPGTNRYEATSWFMLDAMVWATSAMPGQWNCLQTHQRLRKHEKQKKSLGEGQFSTKTEIKLRRRLNEFSQYNLRRLWRRKESAIY